MRRLTLVTDVEHGAVARVLRSVLRRQVVRRAAGMADGHPASALADLCPWVAVRAVVAEAATVAAAMTVVLFRVVAADPRWLNKP